MKIIKFCTLIEKTLVNIIFITPTYQDVDYVWVRCSIFTCKNQFELSKKSKKNKR